MEPVAVYHAVLQVAGDFMLQQSWNKLPKSHGSGELFWQSARWLRSDHDAESPREPWIFLYSLGTHAFENE